MFRPMRRFKQQLSQEENEAILTEEKTGVLAVIGDDGYPYTVPVNHVYWDGKIAFHCAKEGHKIDAILANPKVSFCVVAQDEVIPEERTTAYISVVAFGKARLVEDEAEMRHIAGLIGRKYCPDQLDACDEETEETIASHRLGCVEITVEHLTGKCGLEVIKQRLRG